MITWVTVTHEFFAEIHVIMWFPRSVAYLPFTSTTCCPGDLEA